MITFCCVAPHLLDMAASSEPAISAFSMSRMRSAVRLQRFHLDQAAMQEVGALVKTT